MVSIKQKMSIQPIENSDNETAILLVGLAAIVLGQAIQSGNGAITKSGLVFLALAIVFSALSIYSFRFKLPRVSGKVVWFVLLMGLVLQISEMIAISPVIYGTPEALNSRWQFQVLVIFAGICALISISPEKWVAQVIRKIAIVLVFMCMFLAGVWVIKASPKPFIDTFYVHQSSALAVQHNKNPYELSEPNIYGDLRFYGEKWVKNGRMTVGNGYPPMSIYLTSVGFLIFGDTRYGILLALLISGAFIRSFTKNRFSNLAAFLLLFSPRSFFILEQAWTEPFLIMLLAILVWVCIYHPKWRFVILGLLMASKQYLVVMFPIAFLLLNKGYRPREWIKPITTTIGTALIVTLPLALRNFQKFIWDVGLSQFYQPFRYDTLSFLSAYAFISGITPSQYFSIFTLVLAELYVLLRANYSPSGFSLGIAFSILMFFAFSKQGSPNYYFMVIGALATALSVLPHERIDTEPYWPRRTLQAKESQKNE